MTPIEYQEEKQFKPLTDAEIRNQNKVKISGTKELINWTEIYARIMAGMSMEHIIEIYGQRRKLTLFSIRDGITKDDSISQLVDDEITQRRKMNKVESESPVMARTLKEVANEYAPDISRQVAILTQQMVTKGQDILNTDECSTNDMKNIAQAVQTMTDTVQISDRFSTNAGTGVGINIQVEGFEFVLDKPPVEPDMIEAELTESHPPNSGLSSSESKDTVD